MRTIDHRHIPGACARILLASLALLACLFVPSAGAEADGVLRVKLARLGSPTAIRLRADCDYTLATDPTVRVSAGEEMTLSVEGGSLTLSSGERRAALGASAQLVRSEGGSHGAQFLSPSLSNRFCGDLCFSASSGVITTVLRIYVEDYLYGVVGNEMSPSSALEALKAQAIVARNCALLQKASRSSAAYDLSDSGDVLSFRGYSDAREYADVLRAVDETRGQALYYKDSPAACFFCDSNGGQIESSANAMGVALPYSEVRDDPYDFDGAGVKKTATLRKDGSGLSSALAQALLDGTVSQLKELGLSDDPANVRLNAIEAVEPEKARYAAPSRLYTAVRLTLNVTGVDAGAREQTGRVRVSVPTYGALEEWYELGINEEDNETVWISETDSAFEITFRRSGSGVGLSQRGAQAMARKGLSCWDILEYYYPGTSLRQLELADALGEEHSARATPAVEPIANARLSQRARLYEAPDDTGSALTTLPAGASVVIYAVKDDWAALGSGGLYGYIHTDALTAFALVGVTAAQVRDETYAQISAKAVNVLELPVNSARALGRLSGGDVVRLNAYTDEWAMITTQGQVEGFVPRGALTLKADDAGADGSLVEVSGDMPAVLIKNAGLYVNADDAVAPRDTLAAGERLRVLAYNRSWAYVRTNDGRTGYVRLDELSSAQAGQRSDEGTVTRVEGKQYRFVAGDALPMYESWDTGSAVLAVLEKGTRVRLGAYNEQWACVRVDGLTGFVSLSGLSDTADSQIGDDAIDGGDVVRVEGEQYAVVAAADGATVYATWSDESEALAFLRQGDRVRLGAYNAKWACVRVDGVTGFVKLQCLKKAAD